MKKLKLISDNDELTPIEIKGMMYFISIDYIHKFRQINPNDFKQVGEFMRDIKDNCTAFKL